MAIFLDLLMLIGGIVVAVIGANILVDGASSIAHKLKVSSLVIGMTVVAFGTSMPEFAVNIFSSIHKNTGLAISNILGSNIFNILIILGIAAVIKSLPVHKNTISRDIPMNLLAAILVGVVGNKLLINGLGESALFPTDGIVFLSLFAIFIYYTFYHLNSDGGEGDAHIKKMSNVKAIVLILLGLGGLIAGGELIVNGATELARSAGMSDHLVGLLIVGPGTSIPELLTSLIAIKKGRIDLAVGNVVGSNIFNIFFILGLSSVIYPLPLHTELNIAVMITIAASLLLFIFTFMSRNSHLTKSKGIFFILLYIGYIIYMLLG
jgi:cation:H+ antiporter